MIDLNKLEVSLLTESEKGQLKGGFKKIETLSVESVALSNINCYGASDDQAPDSEASNTNCHSSCKCNA